MSIPTTQDVPVLHDNQHLAAWARRLQEYLRTHLQTFAWPESRITLPNGNSQNVNIQRGYIVHIVGPTAPFDIGGIGGGSPGRQVILHNASSGTMTLNELDTGSSIGNRIRTYGGAIISNVATLFWDHLERNWIMMSNW